MSLLSLRQSCPPVVIRIFNLKGNTPMKHEKKNEISAMNSQEIGINNLKVALDHINRAGWLTAYALGLIMKPELESKEKFAQKLMRKAISKGYVHTHLLTDISTYAYIITPSGADFLTNNGIQPVRIYRQSHKQKNGTYNTPRAWEHHIMSTVTLASLMHSYPGSTIIYEHQIRCDCPGADKIPDGILLTIENSAIWLEMEVQKKDKTDKDKILEAIAAANDFTLYLWPGVHIYDIALAFDPKQLNNKGKPVDHILDWNKFFEKKVSSMIEFQLCNLHVKSYNDIIVENLTPVTKFSQKAKEMAEVLELEDWITDYDLADLTDSEVILFANGSAEYRVEDNGQVIWCCTDNIDKKQGTAKSIKGALRFIAATMIKMNLTIDTNRTFNSSNVDAYFQPY